MNLRDLSYFIAAAEEQSFTTAARRLFLTQQAVSAAMGRLERDVGVALFIRRADGVVLSAAGLRLLPAARQLVLIAAQTVSAARAAAGQELARERPPSEGRGPENGRPSNAGASQVARPIRRRVRRGGVRDRVRRSACLT